MSDWFPAPAITKLNQEIEAKFPGRDHASDGVLGDASHAVKGALSDHNPCWACSGRSYGIVRATDRDVSGWPAAACRDYLIARCRSGAEKRIAYIINNRTIWSSTYGFAPRAYTGSNPHIEHMHISLRHDDSNFSTATFLPTFPATPNEPPAPPKDEDYEMKAYLVVYGGGQWVVAGDLSSRTGISSGTDLSKLAATGQYIQNFPLSESQMARIPVAGSAPA